MGVPDNIKDWFQNNELFKQELAIGRKWQLYIADRIRNLGYDAVVPDEAPYVEHGKPEKANFLNEPDIVVGGLIVEVKSRNYKFNSAADFPFDTIAVETKQGFDSKTDKPVIYVCVSQKTGGFCALDVEKTREHWIVARRFDRVRNIPVVSYDCHRDHWEDLETVCGRLLASD